LRLAKRPGILAVVEGVTAAALICRGLRRISADDHLALDRGAMIYDALYAEIREEEEGDHAERT
jgi:hypothetical protein